MSIYPPPSNTNIFNEKDFNNINDDNNDDDNNNNDLNNYIKKNGDTMIGKLELPELEFYDLTKQTTAFTNDIKNKLYDIETDTMDNTIKLTNFDFNNNYSVIDKIKTNELNINNIISQPFQSIDKNKIYENEGNIILHNNRILALENDDYTTEISDNSNAIVGNTTQITNNIAQISDNSTLIGNNSASISTLNTKTQNISTDTETGLTKIDGDIDLIGNYVKMRNTIYNSEIFNDNIAEMGALNNADKVFYISAGYGINMRAWNNNIDIIAQNNIQLHANNLTINGSNYETRISNIENDITNNNTQITNNNNLITNHETTINNIENDLTNNNTQITSNSNSITNHETRITNIESQNSNHFYIQFPLTSDIILGPDDMQYQVNHNNLIQRSAEIDLGLLLYNSGYTSLFYYQGQWRNYSRYIINFQFKLNHKGSRIHWFKAGLRMRNADGVEHAATADYIDMGDSMTDNNPVSNYSTRFTTCDYLIGDNQFYGSHSLFLKVSYKITTSFNSGRGLNGVMNMRKI